MPYSDNNLYHDVIRMIYEGHHMSEWRVSSAEFVTEEPQVKKGYMVQWYILVFNQLDA